MSHVRRVGGRFSTNAASETYQRQLVAPVNKWKKAWVVPAGLPAESSYKVCKWVRIIAQNGKGESQNGSDSEGEDETPAPGTEAAGDIKEDDGEQQSAENGDSGGDDQASGEGEAIASTEQPADSMDVDEPAPVPEITTSDPEPQAETLPGPSANSTPIEGVAPAAELVLVEPTRSRTRSKSPRAASPARLPPSPSHIPSNAVEISMAAPTGHGGVPGPGGVSVHVPEVGENNEEQETQPEVDIVTAEVVAPDVVIETVTEAKESPRVTENVNAETPADESMPERDEGVVMGVEDVPMLKGDDVAPEDVE